MVCLLSFIFWEALLQAAVTDNLVGVKGGVG